MPAFNNSVGVQPWLNAVKASGEPRFFNGILSSEREVYPGANLTERI